MVDQNKAEYADPVYWYTGENGVMFPGNDDHLHPPRQQDR